MPVNSYEERRLRNIEDNKRILAELGLLNPFKPFHVIQKALKRRNDVDSDYQPRKKAKKLTKAWNEPVVFLGRTRKSSRLLGKDPGQPMTATEASEEEEEHPVRKRVVGNRPNFYGPVPGIEIGKVWDTRLDCCIDGVHRPTVAGIHGGEQGAYSIALSGGYEDDVDLGECFTYTGEGGRDLKGTKSNPKNLRTAPQSQDQTLTRGNLALSRSVETGNVVRVIRGYKLRGPFAPASGYRYDGVYKVEKFWFATGDSGFMVWKFAFRRCLDQAAPPWILTQDSGVSEDSFPRVITSDSEQQEEDTCSCNGEEEKMSSQSAEEVNSGSL